MKTILVSKCLLFSEKYFELKISILISPSKSLIYSSWVTYFVLFFELDQGPSRNFCWAEFDLWTAC